MGSDCGNRRRGARALWGLACLLTLLLAGCSAMLNRPYEVVAPHEYHATAAEGSGLPTASTYQALVNNLFSFVEDGVEQGVIRLSGYTGKTGDIASDINAACNEVANEDPLGAYAVDFIKSDYTRVVKDYEVSVQISYRRTPEQIKALVNVTGSSAIREVLRDALRDFRTEVALRVAYFTEDEAYIAGLIEQAYFDTPEAALGQPQAHITFYPEIAQNGQRIVEITLAYPQEPSLLRRQSETLKLQVNGLLASFSAYGLEGGQAAQALFQTLREYASYASWGGNTAYAALVDGAADSQGMALAYLLLAQQIDLEALLVRGSLGGEPYAWIMVRQSSGAWRHVDPSREDGLLLTDGELEALGYQWPREEYPAAG